MSRKYFFFRHMFGFLLSHILYTHRTFIANQHKYLICLLVTYQLESLNFHEAIKRNKNIWIDRWQGAHRMFCWNFLLLSNDFNIHISLQEHFDVYFLPTHHIFYFLWKEWMSEKIEMIRTISFFWLNVFTE